MSERRIADYDILTAYTSADLIKLVRTAMGDDWYPLGGVSVSLSESDDYQYTIFAQAMVRYQKAES